jgi:hypothetical protein
MALNSEEQRWLLTIINAGLFKNDLPEARRLALNQESLSVTLPDDIKSLVQDFNTRPSSQILKSLSLLLVEKFHLGVQYQLDVVARLVTQNLIEHQKAFDLLSFDTPVTSALPIAHQRCIDTIWLLKEDIKDGFMSLQDDDAFINSLKEISRYELVTI